MKRCRTMWRYVAEQRDINKGKILGVCNLAGVKIGTRRNRVEKRSSGRGGGTK